MSSSIWSLCKSAGPGARRVRGVVVVALALAGTGVGYSQSAQVTAVTTAVNTAKAAGKSYVEIAKIVAAAIAESPEQANAITFAAVTNAPAAAAVITAAAVTAAPTQAPAIVTGAVRAITPTVGPVGSPIDTATFDAIRAIVAAANNAAPGADAAINAAATAAVVNRSGETAVAMAAPRPPATPEDLAPNGKYFEVPILYATDRKPLMALEQWHARLAAKGSDYAYFGPEADHAEDSKPLRFGRCTVSIPERGKHEEGKIERPGLGQAENKLTHFTICRIETFDQAAMESAITKASGSDKEALIFVHGFNVKFSEAAMRAAQLKHDFNFDGAMILYSWSSAGDASFSGYLHDEDNVRATEDDLFNFVDEVVRRANVKKVHIIAHSMGNRALIAVLKRLADKGREKTFGEVVLAAPDVPLGDFRARVAKRVLPVVDRLSIYASSDDKALQLSMKASRHSQLGLSGKDLFVVQGIETIDATGVDTDFLAHNYFAQAKPVIDDIRTLLSSGADPEFRRLEKRNKSEALIYWAIPRVEKPSRWPWLFGIVTMVIVGGGFLWRKLGFAGETQRSVAIY